MADKKNVLMTLLIAIIVVMAAVLVYVFLIRPNITGYAVDRQREGYQIALFEILQVVTQCQTFPVAIGENQTINLIAVECLQQAPQG